MMNARLLGVTIVSVTTGFWAIGLTSQLRLLSSDFNKWILGDCWMQLTLPLALAILGLLTNRYSNLMLAGFLLVISAVSNQCIPRNGFLGSGGQWLWQVPILAGLGGMLMLSACLQKASATTVFSQATVYRHKWQIAGQSPVILWFVVIHCMATAICFLLTLAFRPLSPVYINMHLPFFIASNIALGFAFIALSTKPQVKRILLVAIAVLLTAGCVALVYSLGRSPRMEYKIQIVLVLLSGLSLLSPSMLSWMEFVNTRKDARKFTIADLLYCTFLSALGIVWFRLLG